MGDLRGLTELRARGGAEDAEYEDIPYYPGFQAGTDGSIWTRWTVTRPEARAGKKLRWTDYLGDQWLRVRPWSTPAGLMVSVRRGGGDPGPRLVCELVLETFEGERLDGWVATHSPDPDPANNRLSNLTWDLPPDE